MTDPKRAHVDATVQEYGRRFDVHLLVSSYAQAPSRFYVASVFAPPRDAEDEHTHAHHVEHRTHRAEAT